MMSRKAVFFAALTQWRGFSVAALVVGAGLVRGGAPVVPVVIGLGAASLLNFWVRRRLITDGRRT